MDIDISECKKFWADKDSREELARNKTTQFIAIHDISMLVGYAEHLQAQIAGLKVACELYEKYGQQRLDRISGLEAKNKRLKELFGMENPWTLLVCAKQLVMAANHLLNDHNCDTHGYEKTEIAKKQMQKYISKIEQALKGR